MGFYSFNRSGFNTSSTPIAPQVNSPPSYVMVWRQDEEELITKIMKNPAYKYPRGSVCTTIMESGPKRPSPLWFWRPKSIIVAYMDPLGIVLNHRVLDSAPNALNPNVTTRNLFRCSRAIHLPYKTGTEIQRISRYLDAQPLKS